MDPADFAGRRGGPDSLKWLSALAIVVAGSVARAADHGLGLPTDISSEGWRVDRALNITHLFIIGLCVIAFAWMLWAVIAGRKREHAAFERGDSRKAILLPLGIAAFVYLVVDGHLFVSSTSDLHSTYQNFEKVLAEPDVLKLQINARQWAWDARYAGADERFGTPDDIYVTTDIRVPVGRPVVVQLAAADVVHALYIPNLRVQIDAIPGRIGWVWFQADKAGVYDIACAQHCGVSHYKMSANLHVLEPADFDAWLARESRYAVKMVDALKALGSVGGSGMFPEFGSEPDIAPRAWGWPWSEGER
jgi:cytochrome c oxidase subunit 2